MTYKGPMRRVDRGRNHWYTDANGMKIPGVTSIIGNGLPKPALVGWGIKSVAEYAVDYWDELAKLPPNARRDRLKKAPYDDRDAAARRGTEVHRLAEQLIQGQEVAVPDELAGHVGSYLRFLEEWDPQEFLVEAALVNYTHGYAGTADLFCTLPRFGDELVVMDIKTTRSGIFGETALQLAAYAHAEFYVSGDESEKPLPRASRGFAIHVRADGYDVRELPIGEDVYMRFRYVAVNAETADMTRDWVGDAITPEGAVL